jgi:hypothetical protein
MHKWMLPFCAAITIVAAPVVVSAGPEKPADDPPRIVEIRNQYQETVRDRKSGIMVCDRFEHNTEKLGLPGVGMISYRVSVWRYNEQLWQQIHPGVPVPGTWMAQVSYSRGEGQDESYEFLFDGGNSVVFFYQSLPRSQERRYYFTGDKPIRVIEGSETTDRITAEHRYYSEAVIMRAAYEIKRGLVPEIDMR